MPLQLLQLRPGVNREGTTLSNEGGWYECDKIRFRSGYPQKIGGWSPLSEQTFEGVARSLINWVTLLGYNLVGVGTNSKYYIENGGTYNDVTPVRATSAAGDVTFAATNGSNIITVTDIDHGALPAPSSQAGPQRLWGARPCYVKSTRSLDPVTFITMSDLIAYWN